MLYHSKLAFAITVLDFEDTVVRFLSAASPFRDLRSQTIRLIAQVARNDFKTVSFLVNIWDDAFPHDCNSQFACTALQNRLNILAKNLPDLSSSSWRLRFHASTEHRIN